MKYHAPRACSVTAAAILVGSFIGVADAAVLVTDLGAGVLILNSSTNVDLDNDGNNDVVLSHGVFLDLMRIGSLGGTAWVQDPVAGANYPAQLAAGDTVGAASAFVSSGGWNFGLRLTPNAAWTNPATLEGGGGHGYIGFRINRAGQTHYGWAELDYSDDGLNGGTLLSYAYESTADTPITIPEPSSAMLMGLSASFLLRRRRK